MKTKFIQKVMTGALALSLIAAPSMGALAANGTGDSVGSGGPISTPGPGSSSGSVTVEEAVIAIVNEAGAPVNSIAEIPVTSTVDGVRTTVQGVYLATSVNGIAIVSGLSSIAANYGLAAGEVPYAKFTNMDVKKSVLAKAVIDNAASALGATVGPCINIEIGKMGNGQFSLLSSDGEKITIKVGIPKSFAQADKTFAIIRVRPGGAVSVLQDMDTNPNTVTFETTGGQGAYAIVKY